MGEIKRYVTPVFRLSFPTVFEPSSYEGGPVKYGLSAVWTPSKFSDMDKRRWKAILGALDEESQSRFKKPWRDLPVNIKRGIRDGTEKADMEGYGEGTRFASVTTKMRPGIIDADKAMVVATSAEKEKAEAAGKTVSEEMGGDVIYPGCYCRATVTVYSYDNKGKGVALGLMNLQKVADGDRLDARTDAAEDFDDDIDSKWLEQDDDEFLD